MSDATMSFIDHRPQQAANIENLVVKTDNEELARLCSYLEREDKKEKVNINVNPSEVAVNPTVIVNVPDTLKADITLTTPEIITPAPVVHVVVKPYIAVKTKLENVIIIGLLVTDIAVKIWGALWH